MNSAEDGWNAEGWKQAAIEYRSQQFGGYQTDAECIATLAGMSRLDYDRHRRSAAEQLGIKVDTLDKAVRDHRSQTEEDCASLPHWKFEPPPDPVDGAALLNAIRRIFRRYIILPQSADIALVVGAARLDDGRRRYLAVHGARVADEAVRQDPRLPPAVLPDPEVRAREQHHGGRAISLYRGRPADAPHRRSRYVREEQRGASGHPGFWPYEGRSPDHPQR